MDYPIAGNNQAIIFTPAEIMFPDYEQLVNRAKEVAKVINSVELTEDNIKETKETLAKARKVTDGLDKARKDLKKMIMGNFATTEEQIKFIISIVDDADRNLRDKVKVLEENERNIKAATIAELWDKRAALYQFPQVIENAFARWLKPQHLNKTTTMKSIESDMVAWMEQCEKDIAALKNIGDDYLVAYLDTLNMTEAVDIANKRRVNMALISNAEPEEPVEESAIFIVRGKKNIKLTEMLLTENEIEFERK